MSRRKKVAAYRATILFCLREPHCVADLEYFEDGILVVEDGVVVEVGPAADVLARLSADVPINDYRGRLLLPGLIDCHVHYPQIDMIASYGEQLLEWLEKYAYPAERRFKDAAVAAETAEFFVQQLLANGTTTALIFATVHAQSVDAIFAAAEKRNLRLISGKTLMDHGCPLDLRDTAEGGVEESRRLIERWHGQSRLGYAITPRFAVTSSKEQLRAAGKLAGEFPEVHVHTHLAENEDEVKIISHRFPESRSYLDVYQQHGLLRERSVFAHCLHLDEADRGELSRRGGAIAFCPTSNLFLGSGLFDLAAAKAHNIRVGMGTDVGGGTTLNMLRTLAAGYKVLHLQQQALPPHEALYLATLGAARALYLDDRVGSFAPGNEADFIVVDDSATPLTARRSAAAGTIAERLFALLMLGDDRAVEATYAMGEPVYARVG
ncbi:MAG: guanine deaminase [Woeseia sp.]|nr:guanine deaminase [Woeseia sp.]MBT8096890.1 guanine deaminase [Woeseia sp.]NNE62207.1 guanine deaminase [Woeseia sp.]NNL55297.1 guanine deaminase [Woeseia sp.]